VCLKKECTLIFLADRAFGGDGNSVGAPCVMRRHAAGWVDGVCVDVGCVWMWGVCMWGVWITTNKQSSDGGRSKKKNFFREVSTLIFWKF
jgi:hypothetical protein